MLHFMVPVFPEQKVAPETCQNLKEKVSGCRSMKHCDNESYDLEREIAARALFAAKNSIA